MSTALRIRLHRMNKAGTYDVVHLETEASLVKTNTGASLEDALSGVSTSPTGSLHALTHYKGGSDPVTPESIGAAPDTAIGTINIGIQDVEKRINDLLTGAIETVTDVPYQVGTLTYTGSAQSPVWGNFDDSKMTISGDTGGVDAGEYSVTFTLKKGYAWEDGSDTKTVTWSIGKATIMNAPSQNGSLTYSGGAQSPSWSNYNSSQLTIGGTTSGTNAGTYTAKFTPTANYQWSDGTSGEKSVNWSIGKAAGSISLSTSSIKFTSSGGSKQVTVTRSGTGTIRATSSNTSIATCSVNGNVVTIRPGSTNGTCTITVAVAEDSNHTAPNTKSISVTRDVSAFPTTLGASCTWAGHQWIVVHVTDEYVVLARSTIYEQCVFNTSGNISVYNGSNIADRAKAFENSLPAADLEKARNSVTIGVTSKIFVATYDQINGGFDYFKSDVSRICKYNGVDSEYWTSTATSSSKGPVYGVSTDGSFYPVYPTNSIGFRPFVVVNRY